MQPLSWWRTDTAIWPSARCAGRMRSDGNILIRAAQQVGPALFYSLIIIVVSFLPVFLLEAQEGRMFRPLAWTKTLALDFLLAALHHAGSGAHAVLPARKAAPGIEEPCRPRHAGHLSSRAALVPAALEAGDRAEPVFLAATIPLYFRLGSQFMPALYEGSALYMPSALPGISITQAVSLMQEQDRIIRSFPEVATVFGTVGRSDSATDNAPLDMYDTTIMLKPRGPWRAGMTYEKLIHAMDEKLQFPGLTNTWTMPVENRLDMELTGIKTAGGHQDSRSRSRPAFEEIGAQMQQILSQCRRPNSVFAERVAQGFYLNIEVNRPEAARYGLTVADVQRVITSEIGGADIAENVEGRERFPIAVRYQRDFPRRSCSRLAGPDSHAFRRTDSHQRSGPRLLFARSRHDPRRRRRADRLCLSQSENQRLRRLCESRRPDTAATETGAASGLHLALGGRV